MTSYFAEKAQSALKNFKEQFECSDWIESQNTDGISFSYRPGPTGSGINFYRGQSEFDGSPEFYAKASHNVDEQIHRSWDKKFIAWKIVEKLSDNQRVETYKQSLPFPISARQVVTVHTLVQEDSVWFDFHTSVQHVDVPEESGFVRSTVTVSGFRFAPSETPGKTNVTRIIHIEPNGYIPNSVVNFLASSQIFDAIKNRKALLDRRNVQ